MNVWRTACNGYNSPINPGVGGRNYLSAIWMCPLYMIPPGLKGTYKNISNPIFRNYICNITGSLIHLKTIFFHPPIDLQTISLLIYNTHLCNSYIYLHATKLFTSTLFGMWMAFWGLIFVEISLWYEVGEGFEASLCPWSIFSGLCTWYECLFILVDLEFVPSRL